MTIDKAIDDKDSYNEDRNGKFLHLYIYPFERPLTILFCLKNAYLALRPK